MASEGATETEACSLISFVIHFATSIKFYCSLDPGAKLGFSTIVREYRGRLSILCYRTYQQSLRLLILDLAKSGTPVNKTSRGKRDARRSNLDALYLRSESVETRCLVDNRRWRWNEVCFLTILLTLCWWNCYATHCIDLSGRKSFRRD